MELPDDHWGDLDLSGTSKLPSRFVGCDGKNMPLLPLSNIYVLRKRCNRNTAVKKSSHEPRSISV